MNDQWEQGDRLAMSFSCFGISLQRKSKTELRTGNALP